MPDLQSALEAHLAALSDEDWGALVARVRPPSAAGRLEGAEHADPGRAKPGGAPGAAGRSEAKRLIKQAADGGSQGFVRTARLEQQTAFATKGAHG
jgi:hypothetical protein